MKCKLTTLTPCHIGSGNILRRNIDFVIQGEEVGVISPQKIYAVLGDGGIDKWCQAIDRGENIWNVVKIQNRKAQLKDICSKVLCLNGDASNELKEQITTNGRPYIPGSSLKGAIVSAIVESAIQSSEDALPILKASRRESTNRRTGETVVKYQDKVCDRLFIKPIISSKGEKYDVKYSNLRFLRVGDACFDGYALTAIDCYGLNLRTSKSIIDKSARTLVECINAEIDAEVDIQLMVEYHQECGNIVNPLPEAMQSEENLLNAINAHTLQLLEAELVFWKEQENRAYYHIDTAEEQEELEDYYLDDIKSMIAECRACRSGEEAILRVGYGSGWRFMTGRWFCENSEMWEDVVSVIRGKNRDKYRQYDFPKTRRVGLGTPFGFVKISKLG